MLTEEDIVRRLGLEATPVEQRAKIIANTMDAIQSHVLVKLSERLSESDVETLDALIDSGDDPAVLSFLEKQVGDYEEFVSQVTDQYIASLVNATAALERADTDEAFRQILGD
jgi:hypothetical protein